MRLAASRYFNQEDQAVAVEAREPQHQFPLHNHEFGEIVIVTSGNAWHVLEDEPRLITCGEVLYIHAEDRHAFEEVRDLRLTNLLYRPGLFRLGGDPSLWQGGQAPGRKHWQITEPVLTRLNDLLGSLDRETRSQAHLAPLMAETLFLQLCVLLLRNRFASDGEHLPAGSMLGHILAYLRQNCTAPVDFDDVARRFGFSLHGLNRAFREATATTPHNYLVRLRLEHAMRALRAGEASITRIALASGFNDSNYFSFAFRKLTGLSPSEYRRKAAG